MTAGKGKEDGSRRSGTKNGDARQARLAELLLKILAKSQCPPGVFWNVDFFVVIPEPLAHNNDGPRMRIVQLAKLVRQPGGRALTVGGRILESLSLHYGTGEKLSR